MVIVASAVAAATAGVVLAVGPASGSETPTATTATVDGLRVDVGVVKWVDSGHAMPIPNSGGGYQMPDQMMPGMPTGDDARLSIAVTLTNTADKARGFSLGEEFLLRGGAEAEPDLMTSDTFNGLPRLGPGQAANGVFYFDARPPGPDDPPLYLEWSRSGRTERLAVPLNGAVPQPHHD